MKKNNPERNRHIASPRSTSIRWINIRSLFGKLYSVSPENVNGWERFQKKRVYIMN